MAGESQSSENHQRLRELEQALVERGWTEQALREKEARLRLVLEQVPALVWSTDTDLRFTASMGAGLTALGLRPNQVVGMTLFEYFQTRDPEFVPIAAHRRALEGELVAFETEWAGRVFHAYVEPFRDSDGTVIGTVGVAMDVTDRRRAEEETRGWAEIFQRTAAGVAVCDPKTHALKMVNPAFARMHGRTAEELVGVDVSEVFAPDVRGELPEHIRLCRERGNYIFESKHVRKDSTVFPVIVVGQAVRDGEGELRHHVITVHDTTEWKRAEEEARRWAEVVRHISVGVAIGSVDDPPILLMANPAFERMHGYAPGELVGRPAAEVFAPESRPELPERIRQVHAKGHHTFEALHVRKDGTVFPVEIHATAVTDAEGRPLYRIVTVSDITGRKRMEEEMRQREEEYRLLFEKSENPYGFPI